jgi:hypothetical protein
LWNEKNYIHVTRARDAFVPVRRRAPVWRCPSQSIARARNRIQRCAVLKLFHRGRSYADTYKMFRATHSPAHWAHAGRASVAASRSDHSPTSITPSTLFIAVGCRVLFVCILSQAPTPTLLRIDAELQLAQVLRQPPALGILFSLQLQSNGMRARCSSWC